MNNQPLTISQNIYCEASEKFVELKIVQAPQETDAQAYQRFETQKKALEDSCKP